MDNLKPLLVFRIQNIYPFTFVNHHKNYYCGNQNGVFFSNSTDYQLEADIPVFKIDNENIFQKHFLSRKNCLVFDLASCNYYCVTIIS